MTKKKPWAARIVEALGWTYVVLYAGGLIFAFCVIYSNKGIPLSVLWSGDGIDGVTVTGLATNRVFVPSANETYAYDADCGLTL